MYVSIRVVNISGFKPDKKEQSGKKWIWTTESEWK
jgi:hypothetical protein